MAWLPTAVGLLLLAVAAIVLRHGADRAAHRLFAALYLLSGIKSLAEGVGPAADALHAQAALFPTARVWAYTGAACALAMPALLVLFVLQFPRPNATLARRPWLGALAFVPALAFAELLFGARFGLPFADLVTAINLVAVAATVAAAYLLLRARQATEDRLERRQAGLLMLGFLPSFAATWALTAFTLVHHPTATAITDTTITWVLPAFEAAACLVVAFALLKYRLLDFELKVKGGAKYVLMSVVTGGSLFLAVLYVDNYVLQDQLFAFAGRAGASVMGGLVAMLMFKPVERLSARLTDRLFPDAAEGHEAYVARRAREVYQAQVTHVLRDAHVTDREWAFLRQLRSELGLPEADAKRIESDVEAMLKVDDPRTGLAGPRA